MGNEGDYQRMRAYYEVMRRETLFGACLVIKYPFLLYSKLHTQPRRRASNARPDRICSTPLIAADNAPFYLINCFLIPPNASARIRAALWLKCTNTINVENPRCRIRRAYQLLVGYLGPSSDDI